MGSIDVPNPVTGPFEELYQNSLPDILLTPYTEPQPLETFNFPSPREVRFIKFEVVTFYGNGGGLQFFDVIGGKYQIMSFFSPGLIV